MINILITGASGFVGKKLCDTLCKDKRYSIFRFISNNNHTNYTENQNITKLRIDNNTNWNDLLNNIDCVIHLASIVHEPKKELIDYLDVNYYGTINLASASIKAGVKKFIYISSINVYGVSHTEKDKPLDLKFTPYPITAYGISKYKAEQKLLEFSKVYDNIEFIIIRPTMIYGENAPGNYSRLNKWADLRLPIFKFPKNNLRHFTHIDNLINLIELSLIKKLDNYNIFLCADLHPHSTDELINYIYKCKNIRLITIPFSDLLLKIIFRFLSKNSKFKSLMLSLVVDISETRKKLNWDPVDPIKQTQI